jgi:general secretion pathway protein I
LIEVVVALAVTSVLLAAIGGLMASNIRGTQRVDDHVGLVQALRAIEAELQNRAKLLPGIYSGKREGIDWLIEVTPYPAAKPASRRPPVWFPQRIVVKVRSPAGAILQTETIRLVKGAAP